jgi:hypothetical protein
LSYALILSIIDAFSGFTLVNRDDYGTRQIMQDVFRLKVMLLIPKMAVQERLDRRAYFSERPEAAVSAVGCSFINRHA